MMSRSAPLDSPMVGPASASASSTQQQRGERGRRQRDRGQRVRMASDLSAMMMLPTTSHENDSLRTTATSSSSVDTLLADRFDGMTLTMSSSSQTPGAGQRSSLSRSTQAAIKHTTISTENFGDIVSPALQLRRIKRRLLLEAVGHGNNNNSINSGARPFRDRYYGGGCGDGGGHRSHPAMIDRSDSDVSSSASSLTSAGD